MQFDISSHFLFEMRIDLKQIISSFCRGLFRESVQKSCKKQTISGFYIRLFVVWFWTQNFLTHQTSNVRVPNVLPFWRMNSMRFGFQTFKLSTFTTAVAVVRDANVRDANSRGDEIFWIHWNDQPPSQQCDLSGFSFLLAKKTNRAQKDVLGNFLGNFLKIYAEFYNVSQTLGRWFGSQSSATSWPLAPWRWMDGFSDRTLQAVLQVGDDFSIKTYSGTWS